MGGACTSQEIPAQESEMNHNLTLPNEIEGLRCSSVVVVWSRCPSHENIPSLGTDLSMMELLIQHDTPSSTPVDSALMTSLELPKPSKDSFVPMDERSSLSSFPISLEEDFELRPSL